MNIRKATPADRDAMTAILNEIIAIGGTTAYENPLDAGYFDRLISPDDRKIFLHVAEAEGEIIGLQWMEPFDPPDEDTGGIATFAKPGTAQRGIGAALFAVTRARCIAVGYTALIAKIRADNTGGLAYYAKMGFEDHDVVKGAPLKDGTPVDRFVKRMVL